MNNYNDEIKRSFGEIDQELTNIQDVFIQKAQLIGQTSEVIKAAGKSYLQFFSTGIDREDTPPILRSIGSVLSAYKLEVQEINKQAQFINMRITDIASSAAAIYSTAGALLPESYQQNYALRSPIIIYKQNRNYSKRFMQFDLALGQTYQEINEILFGTKSDPERAAMFIVRQAFDQFFSILAPDDKVRSSKYWRPKNKDESKDTNAVWREERLIYAAVIHIKDPYRAHTLSEQTGHILKTYKLLNKAHERGELNKDQALNIIDAMKTILEEWVDAIGI